MTNPPAINDALLGYLREQIGAPVGFAEHPVAVMGGYETSIFAFSLTNAPPEFARELILRVYPGFVDPARATYEKAVHDTLVAGGYPAPRVLFASADAAVLGGGFLVMERLAGRALADDFFARSTLFHLKLRALGHVGRTLAQLHLRLHSVPSGRFLQTLAAEGIPETAPLGRVSTQLASFVGRLEQLAGRIDAAKLNGLARGIDWLSGHRPQENDEVLCHGDLHPRNIMSDHGEISGVTDWSLATMASPAFDVGNTIMILTQPSGANRGGFASALARSTAKRYLRNYQKEHPLDMDAVRYYEAYRCLRSLVWAAENKIARITQADVRPSPWDAPEVSDALAARFEQISSVAIGLS